MRSQIPAGWLLLSEGHSGPCGGIHLRSWYGFLLTPPKSKAISHYPACLPLGLRKWMEGHLGTPEGLEIPTGSCHPGSSPQSSVPRLPATIGGVRSGWQLLLGWDGLPSWQHGSPDPFSLVAKACSGAWR